MPKCATAPVVAGFIPRLGVLKLPLQPGTNLRVKTVANIDWGKPVMLATCALFMCIHAAQVTRDTANLTQLDLLDVLGLVHAFLLLSFYALLVAAYCTRPPAKLGSRSRVTKLAAVIATFLPCALPFVSTAPDEMRFVLPGNCFAMAGLGFTLYALTALGRNVSIVPEARSLVDSGPYGVVRHPLYAGELLTTFGIVLARPGLAAAAVWLGVAALQVYRARREEEVLQTIFPEYREYALRTPGFVPGLAPLKRR